MYALISYIANYFTATPTVETRIIKCNSREEAEQYAVDNFNIVAPHDLPRIMGVKKGNVIKTWSNIWMFSNHCHGDAVCFADAYKTARRWVNIDSEGMYLKVPRTPAVNRAMSTMPNRVKGHSAKYARIVVDPHEWPDAEMHPRKFQAAILKFA